MIQSTALLCAALGILGTVADSSGLAGLGAAGAGGMLWYLSTRIDRIGERMEGLADRVSRLEAKP